MKQSLILSALFFVLAIQLSWAQIPQTMSYQGILTDADGAVVSDGDYNLTFSIYNAVTSGSVLWTESHTSVAVADGIFNVILGSGTPLNIAFDAQYWLEVEVNGAVLSPRVQLTSSPYSLNAQSVADGAVTTNKLDSNAVTGDKIADGQVVRSINGKTDIVSLLEGANITITPGLNSLTISATDTTGSDWSITGNAGTSPPTNFLGTTDDSPLALHVFGARVLLLEPHSTSPNLIGGYSGNWITGGVYGATIGGGGVDLFPNRVTSNYGTVGGGMSNEASANAATVGGGSNNAASAGHAAVGGGYGNIASGNYATVGGGESNVASAGHAAVGGGIANAASGGYAAVPGGHLNAANGNYSFAAGRRAKALHNGSFVWGDSTDADVSSSGVDQFIVRASGGVWMNSGAGGLRLEPNVNSPNIIGGYSGNWVTDGVRGVTIGGGGENGNENRVTDNYGTVGGGYNNQAGDNTGTTGNVSCATVGGGWDNTAEGGIATVSGGRGNAANANYAAVGGGYMNEVSDDFGTVGGGSSNRAGDGTGTTDSAIYATVGGGQENVASYRYATIGGGYDNDAHADYATIGGGENNEVTNFYGTIAGGKNNTACSSGTVGGGVTNTASGTGATVPGGFNNTAAGYKSFAAGYRAKANGDGCFVWADKTEADFTCSTDNKFNVRCYGGARFVTGKSGFFYTGVNMNSGDGAWTTMSDRNIKENFAPVDGLDVLKRLASIPVERWNYKSQDPSIRHMGPMAQDFYAAFGLGSDDKRISTIDPDGVALAAIQGLYELVQEKEAENVELRQQVGALETRLEALEAIVLSGRD